MKTGDVCTRRVVVAGSAARLPEIAKLMRKNHVGTVVIVDAGLKPVGMVTDRDIVLEAVACDLDARILTAGEIMSTDVAVAQESDEAAWSLKAMRDRGVRRLPVVSASGAMVGILALDDLLTSAAVQLGDVVQAIGTERLNEGQRRKVPA